MTPVFFTLIFLFKNISDISFIYFLPFLKYVVFFIFAFECNNFSIVIKNLIKSTFYSIVLISIVFYFLFNTSYLYGQFSYALFPTYFNIIPIVSIFFINNKQFFFFNIIIICLMIIGLFQPSGKFLIFEFIYFIYFIYKNLKEKFFLIFLFFFLITLIYFNLSNFDDMLRHKIFLLISFFDHDFNHIFTNFNTMTIVIYEIFITVKNLFINFALPLGIGLPLVDSGNFLLNIDDMTNIYNIYEHPFYWPVHSGLVYLLQWYSFLIFILLIYIIKKKLLFFIIVFIFFGFTYPELLIISSIFKNDRFKASI